jgi:hypothetical protein
MNSHYTIMFFIMFISGLLSTMNIYADKLSDVRWSLNDIYMTLLMTGWMFFLMGLYYKEFNICIIGLSLIIINIYCIRSQFLIGNNEYLSGMIPHHSMAIFMSKRLLEKRIINPLTPFLKNIINTQEKEIKFMKGLYSV